MLSPLLLILSFNDGTHWGASFTINYIQTHQFNNFQVFSILSQCISLFGRKVENPSLPRQLNSANVDAKTQCSNGNYTARIIHDQMCFICTEIIRGGNLRTRTAQDQNPEPLGRDSRLHNHQSMFLFQESLILNILLLNIVLCVKSVKCTTLFVINKYI